MKADVLNPSAQSLAMDWAGVYLQLARPRLALLVLVTVGAGWFLAAKNGASCVPLIHAWVATILLFAGASALNQLLERHTDALMPRTSDRPLPVGRLQSRDVLLLGCALSTASLVCLISAHQFLGAGM